MRVPAGGMLLVGVVVAVDGRFSRGVAKQLLPPEPCTRMRSSAAVLFEVGAANGLATPPARKPPVEGREAAAPALDWTAEPKNVLRELADGGRGIAAVGQGKKCGYGMPVADQ